MLNEALEILLLGFRDTDEISSNLLRNKIWKEETMMEEKGNSHSFSPVYRVVRYLDEWADV